MLAALQEPEGEAGEGEGEHLRARAPGGSGHESAKDSRGSGPMPLSGTTQIEQHETSGSDEGRKYDECDRANTFPKPVKDELREPLVRYPGVAGPSKGEGIGVGYVARFQDPLSGAEMPPEIGIDGVAGGQGEQTEEQDAAKNLTSAPAKNRRARRCEGCHLEGIIESVVQKSSR